jgi:hypothetical protein
MPRPDGRAAGKKFEVVYEDPEDARAFINANWPQNFFACLVPILCAPAVSHAGTIMQGTDPYMCLHLCMGLSAFANGADLAAPPALPVKYVSNLVRGLLGAA